MHIPLDNAKYSTGLETSWDHALDAILNNISSTCCVWGAKIPACAFLGHGMKGDPVFSASVYIRRPVLFSSGVSAFARNWEVDTQTKKLGKNCPFSKTEDRSLSTGLGCGGLCLLRSLPSYLSNLTICPWHNEPGKRWSSWAARFSGCILYVTV